MRSRYDLTKDSTVMGSDGTAYKDIFTLPLRKFNYNTPSTEVSLDKEMIRRPDYLASRIYQTDESELDDLVLMLNDIGLIHYSSPGDIIDAPSSNDLENFYYQYRV